MRSPLGFRARSACVVASLAAVNGGCTFAEPRPGLDVAVPKTYDHATAGAAAQPLPADWPKLFGSRELDTLGRQAATQNLDVAAAAARIVQADAQTVITSSLLYPQIASSGDASRSYSGGGGSSVSTVSSSGVTGGSSAAGGTGSGTTTVSTPSAGTVATRGGSLSNSFQLGLTASYEVDLWGKNGYSSLAASQAALASRFARDALVLSSVAGTVNAYFTILSTQDRLKIADNNLKVARDALAAIEARLAVGTVTALEVSEQQSIVDQQLAAFPPLQQTLQQAKTQIAILTGRTPESLSIRGGSLDAMKPPAIPAGLPSDLLRRRPDVAQAEATLAAADSDVQSARAAFFPTLTLTGKGGFESSVLRTLLSPGSEFASIAAGVTEPLFDGFNLQGQLALARGRTREDLATYRKAAIQALVDVENALIAVQQTTEHEKRLDDVVRSSKLAFDIARARLNEGTVDIVTVLSTEQTLFGAEDAAAVARLTRFQALSSLAQALGGGFRIPALPVPPSFTIDGTNPVEAIVPLTALKGS